MSGEATHSSGRVPVFLLVLVLAELLAFNVVSELPVGSFAPVLRAYPMDYVLGLDRPVNAALL